MCLIVFGSNRWRSTRDKSLRVFDYKSHVTEESLPRQEQFAIAKSGLTFSVDVAQSHLFPAIERVERQDT